MIEKKILTTISAEGTEWQNGAPCVTADFDFVPDVETDEGVNEAQQWCRTCDVRTTCLAWAMLHGAEGYWRAYAGEVPAVPGDGARLLGSARAVPQLRRQLDPRRARGADRRAATTASRMNGEWQCQCLESRIAFHGQLALRTPLPSATRSNEPGSLPKVRAGVPTRCAEICPALSATTCRHPGSPASNAGPSRLCQNCRARRSCLHLIRPSPSLLNQLSEHSHTASHSPIPPDPRLFAR